MNKYNSKYSEELVENNEYYFGIMITDSEI